MMRYTIGIDAGTTNIKAVLFDEDGNEVLVSSRENEVLEPTPGTSEQDMNLLWERVRECLYELSTFMNNKEIRASAVGICAQGEGVWLIDEEGRPVRNAVLWNDSRAADLVTSMDENTPELCRTYYETTGVRPLTGNQMVLLRWLNENEPETLHNAAHILFCKDWIRYRLTGTCGLELTDSVTSMIDTSTETTAADLLEQMGLGFCREKLTAVHRSDEIAGTVSETAAEETGLPAGIPVIYGAMDVSATVVGLGALAAGDTCVILGTTCACETVQHKKDCRFGAEGTRYERHPLEDLYLYLQPTLNGTPNIDWMCEQLAEGMPFSAIDALIETVPVGSNGVTWLPYLAGERSPFFHPFAKAEFFGISRSTSRADLIRAVYEGLSFSIRDCLPEHPEGTMFLAGGGAKSPVWAQMIADVTGMKVMTAEGSETGAKGAAIMAGKAAGIYADYPEAVRKTCRFSAVYEPRQTRTAQYDILFDLYRRIRQSHTQVWYDREQAYRTIRTIQENKQ